MKLILRSRTFFWAALAFITLGGAFLRAYDIDRVPAGLYPDEAMNGTDAISAIETGDYALFYPDNFGREGLFINLQAVVIRFLGPTVPALKLPSIVFGSLAILGTGLLAWELFRSRYAALIAAFLVATSYWAINFSRIGFRAIMIPALLSFSLFFLFRGIRKEKTLPFLVSGLIFGIGLHTYIAFRLAPLILILTLPFLLLSYDRFLTRFRKHALFFVLGAALTAAPMFFLFATHPETFSSRSAEISIFSPEINGGHFWETLGKTVGLSLIKYNFVGDQNWRHNHPPYPILDPLSGTFFLAGLLFSILMFVRILGERIRTGRRDTELVVHASLLSGFLVMLAPEFLTGTDLPHALRSIGTQPFVFLFATIPLLFLFRTFSRSQSGAKVGLALFLIFVLSASALWNVTGYFVFFAHDRQQYASFNTDLRNMAEYIVSLPETTNVYVVPGSFVEGRPIAYLTHGRRDDVVFLGPGPQDRPVTIGADTTIESPAVVLSTRVYDSLLEDVRLTHPDAYGLRIDLRPGTGTDFTAIMVPSS